MTSGKEIFLHVGLPKTATTFLQRDYFPTLPILYCDHKRENFDRSLRVDEIHNLHSTSILEASDDWVQTVDGKLERLFKETQNTRLLISDESLVGGWYNNFLSTPNLLRHLSRLFPYQTVVLAIRRQDTFVKSLYTTSVTVGNHEPFEKFINYDDGSFRKYRRLSAPNLAVHALNWNKLVSSYEREFGADNVHVIPFEKIKTSVDSYLKEFAEVVDVPYELPPTRGKRNPQTRHITFRMARLRNRFGFIDAPLAYCTPAPVKAGITKISGLISRQSFTIDKELSNKILRIHAETNKTLSERRNLDLEEYGYY